MILTENNSKDTDLVKHCGAEVTESSTNKQHHLSTIFQRSPLTLAALPGTKLGSGADLQSGSACTLTRLTSCGPRAARAKGARSYEKRVQNGGRDGVFSDGPMRAAARNGSGRKNLLSTGGARVISRWSVCRLSAKRRRRPSGEPRPCCWPWLAAPAAPGGADGSRLSGEGCAPATAHPMCDSGQPGQGRDCTPGLQQLGIPTSCLWAGIRKHNGPPAGNTSARCKTTPTSECAWGMCGERMRTRQRLRCAHEHGAGAGGSTGTRRTRAGTDPVQLKIFLDIAMRLSATGKDTPRLQARPASTRVETRGGPCKVCGMPSWRVGCVGGVQAE
jgi:hypothetical protein